MAIVETAKKIAEQVTGCRRPDRNDLPRLIRARKANTARFKDDGVIPNHPRWPLVVYRTPVRLPGALDPAAVFEEIFAENGWGSSWRDKFTITSITTPEFMRCSASRAAMPRFDSVGCTAEHFASTRATLRSFLRELDINASARAAISSWSERIRPPAPMMNARRAKITPVPSRRLRQCGDRATIRSTGSTDPSSKRGRHDQRP